MQKTTTTTTVVEIKTGPSRSSFLYGLLLGALSSGLILATITTLWLTSGNKNTSSSTTAPIELRWMSAGVTIFGQVNTTGSALNVINFPYGISFDSLGALYAADYSGDRIQKVTIGASNSVVVAGNANGIQGSDSYHLSQPVHMAFDSDDNMYVSDRGNLRIQLFKKSNLSGTTVAGITGSNGSAYNQLDYPTAIAYDSKTECLYVADTYNQRVMKYERNALNGTVVAGGNGNGLSTSQISLPYGLYFDVLSNSLLISDFAAHRIVRWTLGDSNWTLIAGSSSGISGVSSTLLNKPLGLTLDPMGNLYVADLLNHRIQFFLAGLSIGRTIAGVTTILGANSSLLNRPYWVALDNQLNLYISDTFNNRIQMFKRY